MKKFALALFTIVVVAIISLIWLLKQPFSQTYLAQKAMQYVADTYGVQASVGKVRIQFLNRVSIDTLFIADKQADTLLYFNNLDIEIAFWSLLNPKLVANSIILNGAVVNLYRNKEQTAFNYEFLTTPDTPSPPTSLNDTLPLWLHVQNIQLNQIRLRYADIPGGQTLNLNLQKADLAFNKLDLNLSAFDIDHLLLDKGEVNVEMFSPDSLLLAALPQPAAKVPENGTAQTSMQVLLSALDVSRVCFDYTDFTQPATKTGGLDVARLSVNDVEAHLQNLLYTPDTLSLLLKQLSFAEKSGFICQQLGAGVRYGAQGLTLSDFYFETPLSVIQADLQLQYPNTDAFTNQPQLVNLTLKLPKLQLHENDLFLLYPDVKSYQILKPQNIALIASTKLSGTLDDLLLQNTSVNLGQTAFDAASIALLHPTDRKKVQYKISKLHLQTAYPALTSVFYSALIPAQLATLGNISLSGEVIGSTDNAKVLANLVSDAGNIAADVALWLNEPMRYSGKVALDRFEAGKVAEMDSLLGQITLNADFALQGTNIAQLKGTANIGIKEALLMGYNYQNAEIGLIFDKNIINTTASITDPNLTAQLQATANLRNPLPQINTQANIKNLNTTALGLYNWDYTLGTQIDANLQGNSADNLSGTLKLNDTRFTRNDTTSVLKQVLLDIREVQGVKTVTLQSDIADAKISGNFEPANLASGIMRTVNQYYHAFPDTFSRQIQPQQAVFELATKDISLLQRLFVPELKRLDSCLISGTLNEQQNLLTADMEVHNMAYDTYLLEKMSLTTGSKTGQLKTHLNLKQLHIQSDTTETVLPGAQLSTIMSNDSLLMGIIAQTDTVGTALALNNLLVTIANENVAVQLLSDSIVLNNATWQVKPDNALTISSDGVEAKNFRLGYGSGQLSINNKEDGNRLSPLLIEITNFAMQDLSKLAGADSLEIKGNLNGMVEIANPLADLTANVHLGIDELNYQGGELGTLMLQAQYDNSGKVPLDISLSGNYHSAQLTGSYNLNDAPNALNLGLDLRDIDLSAFQALAEGSVNDLSGHLFGKIRIEGPTDAPRLSGGLQLDSLNLYVPTTNATYTLQSAKMRIDPLGFHLEPAVLIDQTGSALNLQADIEHQNFENIAVNMHAWGSNLQLMNTKASPDMPAYGVVNGNLDVKVNGMADNPDIKVFFETGKNTDVYVTLPENESNIEKEQLVTFGSQTARIDSVMQKMVQLDKERKEKAAASAFNYNLTLKLAATNDAQLTIVIDPAAGDQLSCTGEGNITVETDAKGDMVVAGDYTLDNGDYQMTLNDLVKRKFSIEKGSTLNFAGDPMATRFNITAIYEVETPAFDMVSEFADQLSDDEISKLKKKQIVQVALGIKGTIAEPKLAFNIILPKLQEEPNTLVERKLAQIRENDTELNKQSFGLIMFNRFIPASNVPNVGTPDAAEIVYSSLSKMVSDQLNNLAGKYVKGMEITVNVESEGSGTDKSRELQYGVSQQLFNERINVQVGGTVYLDNQQQSNASLAPDVAIEYKITKDGKVKARVFRKDRYHQLTQLYRPTTGIAISYKRKFGLFNELFKKQKGR